MVIGCPPENVDILEVLMESSGKGGGPIVTFDKDGDEGIIVTYEDQEGKVFTMFARGMYTKFIFVFLGAAG